MSYLVHFVSTCPVDQELLLESDTISETIVIPAESNDTIITVPAGELLIIHQQPATTPVIYSMVGR